MTAPRQVLPNATYLITRRCFGRTFLLRPSPLVVQTFEYVLAAKAKEYGIRLHAYCVLSNHLHCVLTDPQGQLPRFQRDLGSTIARALNAAHGRWESFWAPGSYSAVALQSAEDILDKMAYVLANPVAAGLTRRAVDWPGAWSPPSRIGAGEREVRRPDHFFRKDGPTPAAACLELVCPPGFASADALRARLTEEVEKREHQTACEFAQAGRSFLGVSRVTSQDPFGRPTAVEPRGGLKPRLAAKDRWKRLEAIGRLKQFLVAYRAAWKAFVRGVRDVVFPEGTYWMRVTFGAVCDGSP